MSLTKTHLQRPKAKEKNMKKIIFNTEVDSKNFYSHHTPPEKKNGKFIKYDFLHKGVDLRGQGGFVGRRVSVEASVGHGVGGELRTRYRSL